MTVTHANTVNRKREKPRERDVWAHIHTGHSPRPDLAYHAKSVTFFCVEQQVRCLGVLRIPMHIERERERERGGERRCVQKNLHPHANRHNIHINKKTQPRKENIFHCAPFLFWVKRGANGPQSGCWRVLLFTCRTLYSAQHQQRLALSLSLSLSLSL